MRVLVACEFSGRVRDAFRARGHDAWSCDLLPSETDGPHLQGSVLDVFQGALGHSKECNRWYGDWELGCSCGLHWDLLIAHPPCTHLAVSGARWFKDKQAEQAEAVAFFMAMVNAPIPRIAVENPVSIMSTLYRKPDQIIQPWQFGHGETKATCLWLKNLPKLLPTRIVEGREARIHKLPPSPDRWKLRSTTYQGIADAMAEQWGSLSPAEQLDLYQGVPSPAGG